MPSGSNLHPSIVRQLFLACDQWQDRRRLCNTVAFDVTLENIWYSKSQQPSSKTWLHLHKSRLSSFVFFWILVSATDFSVYLSSFLRSAGSLVLWRSSSVAYKCQWRSSSVARGWVVMIPPHPIHPPLHVANAATQKHQATGRPHSFRCLSDSSPSPTGPSPRSSWRFHQHYSEMNPFEQKYKIITINQNKNLMNHHKFRNESLKQLLI